ncbi:MAG: PDZ domain-containing protein [Proteobacteria bacterium]|nr:PDZ domain-containing protein [Pseudomonadota bacterium]
MSDTTPRSRWRALAAALVLFAAGCAGIRESAAPDVAEALSPVAMRFFTVAYDQIADKYIQPVKPASLAEAGLANLRKMDAKLNVTRTGDSIEVKFGDELIDTVSVPRRDDAQSWGELTVAVLETGRRHSTALQLASMESLYQTVIDGALSGLDPYSRYAGQEAARESRASRDGFGGVGITIDAEGGDVRITMVMTDSPAARGDLRVDDRITHIEGQSTGGMDARDVVRKLRGPIGKPVHVQVSREGLPQPLYIAMTRALIVPQTVAYRRDGNIGYIRLSGFNHQTADKLTDAVRAAKREIGPELRGIVLDLRGNLGGLLDQAISVSDVFLAEGQIVSTRGRHRASGQVNEASRGDIGESIPLVLLVNGASASAAEIVAAALQDHGRAIVIGSATFGKGSVQTIIGMPNDGELVLTWARFHAPSGYPLQDLGIMPTICTSGAPDDAPKLLDAVRHGSITSAAAFADWRRADHADTARIKQLRAQCAPETKERASDLQLARELLADRTLYSVALQSVQVATRGW